MKKEEDYYLETRKDFRKQRKDLQLRDRSKYKKSDQNKIKEKSKTEDDSLIRGRVLSINLEGILVDSNGEQYLCSLKGILKKESSQLKNLIAVGDFVLFAKREHSLGSIASIEERKSILSRADNLARKKQQLIAVNIDQVLITTSVVSPSLKPYLVDRYIIAARKGNMDPIIVVNKVDLLDIGTAEEKITFEEFLQTYKNLDIPVIQVSAQIHKGIDELKAVMRGKTSVFSGQSGVGKSSLINAVLGTHLKVGNIVEKTSKGSHTTTTSHLIPLEGDGFCIDTPGIKSFGIWDLSLEDVQAYFPEFLPFAENCKYLDCAHINEPQCAVKIAKEKHRISPLRYSSYVALIESVGKEHYHR